MKTLTLILSIITLAGCGGKSGSDSSGDTNTPAAAAYITGFQYSRSGGFLPASGPTGRAMTVTIDPANPRFRLKVKLSFRNGGDVECAPGVFSGDEYVQLTDNLKKLHQSQRAGMIVDAGVAYISIASSVGPTVDWVLDSSDNNASELPVLGGAADLESQLYRLSRTLDCGVNGQ